MNLLIYGPPGSGKGTQAELLHQAFDIPHISTGDILRGEVGAGTELGLKAQPIMAAGGYVPDDIMIGIIRNRLQQGDSAKGFVIDGFPRTIPQAEALDSLLNKELGRRFDRAIYLNVETPELVRRLAGRMTCPADQKTYPPGTERCPLDGARLIQREDDKPEAVKKRIEVYLEKTLPLLDYYQRQGLVSEVDGVGTILEIHKRVLAALGQSAEVAES
ncbi:MAG: adenylate kinase [Chloroflexi bacterium]|nr:MAG: adenylate kinase [Chloroflexota bacterium]TMF00898.1 MAG: adenylate kinase [Chloroflexota bacterium]